MASSHTTAPRRRTPRLRTVVGRAAGVPSPTDPISLDEAVTTLQQFGAHAGSAFGERESEAMAVLYNQFAGTLLTVAHRLTRNNDDAQDIVQEVFTELPRALQHYRPGRLAGWLRCVTARAALMHLRKRTRRREESFAEIASPAWDVAAPDDRDPRDAAAVRRAVDALRGPLRQVVVLRMYADLSHQQIAELLGISPNASEVRLCRAIKQLRGAFAAAPAEVAYKRTGS